MVTNYYSLLNINHLKISLYINIVSECLEVHIMFSHSKKKFHIKKTKYVRFVYWNKTSPVVEKILLKTDNPSSSVGRAYGS